MKLSKPLLTFLVGLQCIAIFISGYVLEYVLYYAPCVLCFVQRFLFLFCGIFLILAFAMYSKGVIRKSFNLCAYLSAIGGFVVGIYHMSLQMQPKDIIHNCRQDVSQMLDNWQLGKVFAFLLQGTPECQIVQTFLGVNLVYWSLMLFALIIVELALITKKVG